MFVKCQQTDCAHNKNNLECYAYTIAMKGRSARNSNETNCGSFVKQKVNYDSEFSEELTNSTRSRANIATIECEASFCVFNREHNCFADGVNVSQTNKPNCLTFKSL